MIEDNEGFLQPVVDLNKCRKCGKCEKACPVIHPEYKNRKPKCFAMQGSDQIREVSSSGGLISYLSSNVLNKNGSVYGAAWDKNLKVKQIKIKNEKEISKIRSSKYVQSETCYTFQECATDLKSEKLVLYTGTPCQIAGLKSYLKSRNISTDNLLTVDLICHGVPNSKSLRKYIKDEFGNDAQDKIKKIDFREKKIYGWSSTTNIYFNDGSKNVHRATTKDPWFNAFLPCLMLRRSCATCPFSRLPRQGDITAGDFWGCEKVDPALNDKKGTSFILINNKKGKKFLDQVKPHFKVWKEVSLESGLRINKTIDHPFAQHHGRKHFFSAFNLKKFAKLTEDALKDHYDVGIVGLWYGLNYGSVLTYFALYSVLRSLGKDAVMLPKPNNLWNEDFNKKDSIAQRFIWKNCNVFLPFEDISSYSVSNLLCDDFVIGSDVVWNYTVCGRDTNQFFFLDWVKSGHRKIAYAASCGNGLAGPDEYTIPAKYYLKRFDAISVREKISVNQLKSQLNNDDISLVLDPVFLLSADFWRVYVRKPEYEQVGQNFIFSYFLRRDDNLFKLRNISLIKTKYNLTSRISGGALHIQQIHAIESYKQILPLLSIEEWLYYISECKFCLADSYHALCFALIFHKPFALIYTRPNKKDGTFTEQRFFSLLSLVGLMDRIVDCNDPDCQEKMERIIESKIDWNSVDHILTNMKDFSLSWLKTALEKKPKTPEASDIIIDGNQYKFKLLSDRIESLTRKLNSINH